MTQAHAADGAWALRNDLDRPTELDRFVTAASEWEDDPEHRHDHERAVIDAARHLLSTDYPGESVVAVPERLGHEDATLVLTTYGHLMPDSENRTRRAVDEARRAPSAPQDDEGAL